MLLFPFKSLLLCLETSDMTDIQDDIQDDFKDDIQNDIQNSGS